MLSLLADFPLVSFLGIKNSNAFLARKIGVKKVFVIDLDLRIKVDFFELKKDLFLTYICEICDKN